MLKSMFTYLFYTRTEEFIHELGHGHFGIFSKIIAIFGSPTGKNAEGRERRLPDNKSNFLRGRLKKAPNFSDENRQILTSTRSTCWTRTKPGKSSSNVTYFRKV